jgi:hypothetical protein
MSITRYNTVLSKIAVGTTVGASDSIPFADYAGGEVYIPAASSITTLTWWGSDDGVTYYAIQDGAGTAVQSIDLAASEACPIPDECFGCAYLRAVGNAAGTVKLTLKG